MWLDSYERNLSMTLEYISFVDFQCKKMNEKQSQQWKPHHIEIKIHTWFGFYSFNNNNLNIRPIGTLCFHQSNKSGCSNSLSSWTVHDEDFIIIIINIVSQQQRKKNALFIIIIIMKNVIDFLLQSNTRNWIK